LIAQQAQLQLLGVIHCLDYGNTPTTTASTAPGKYIIKLHADVARHLRLVIQKPETTWPLEVMCMLIITIIIVAKEEQLQAKGFYSSVNTEAQQAHKTTFSLCKPSEQLQALTDLEKTAVLDVINKRQLQSAQNTVSLGYTPQKVGGTQGCLSEVPAVKAPVPYGLLSEKQAL